MRLAVVEITSNGSFWSDPEVKCYSDPQDLIDDISAWARYFSVQRRMCGGWGTDYGKICERANERVFRGIDHWRAPIYNFVGEYDSEDIHNVWKIECCERTGKREATYAFYVMSSNESDAIVIDFDDDGVMNEYSIRDKNGNEKQLQHSGWEWEVIKHLVERLQLNLPNKNIAEGTMIYFVVAKDAWCYKKMH